MIQLIDDNFNLHAHQVIEQTEGMRTFHERHLTYADSGLSCDTFNIIHIHDGQLLTQNELEKALNHFKAQSSEYCIWINEQNLQAAQNIFQQLQLEEQNQEVGMVLDLQKYQLQSNEQHTAIRQVRTAEELQDFAEVIASNWNPMDENVLAYYQKTTTQYLQSDRIQLLVYYVDGQAVSSIELFPTNEEVLGIYGLATKEAFRGRGIGSAMMTYALNLAKRQNYQKIILQASSDGIGIYRRYGFQTYTNYYEFV